jgi:myb proto-oncogene protein
MLDGGFDGDDELLSKRSVSDGSAAVAMVSTGLTMNLNPMSPGVSSGSDVSDSMSVPMSHVYRPTARTGGVTVAVQPPVETTATTSSSTAGGGDDPATSLSLSLSLPGVGDSGEVSKLIESTINGANLHHTSNTNTLSFLPERHHGEELPPPPATGVVGFNADFMGFMQDMIRKEVRSYMMGMGIGMQNGGGGASGGAVAVGGGGGGLCYHQAANAVGGGGQNRIFRNVTVNNRIE